MTPLQDLRTTLFQLYIVSIPFFFFAMLSIAGLYYGLWDVSPPSPDDSAFVQGVSGVVDGVFGVVEGVVAELVEEVGERL